MKPAHCPATAAVIGGGPAGLMAAEQLLAAGFAVSLYDAMPSVGRKFLRAGVGGMNITHADAPERLLTRFGAAARWLAPLLEEFGPGPLRAWIHQLGIDTFVGSSGKVFPVGMKAAPLLRAWLARLKAQGLQLHSRHRWLGWDARGALRFAHPAGELAIQPAATILALGGGSWPQLGSDGHWQALLRDRGVQVAELLPANSGFDCGWSARFSGAGLPLKNVAIRTPDGWQRGELLLTASGLEGSLIYRQSARLRDALAGQGGASLQLDLLPDRSEADLVALLSQPRAGKTLTHWLKNKLGLDKARQQILFECADSQAAPAQLAAQIKCLTVPLLRCRPLAEAISSAGGVARGSLTDDLMLKPLPGVFCAGEMLDWEAPTGGYLLTACFATGRHAGRAAADYLRNLLRGTGC